MTTVQSVPHAFSSASNVTVSPFQQSPNTSSYLAKMRKQITKLKELAKKRKKEYKQSHVRGRKDGDLTKIREKKVDRQCRFHKSYNFH